MKICPVGAELFHVDGQTERHDEANSRFSRFCEGAEQIRLKNLKCRQDVDDLGVNGRTRI